MHRLFALICPLALLGCESILEIELERVAPELVVTSLFTEHAPWQVMVQRTVGVQEDLTHPSIIDHATVSIEGSNGSLIELVHRGGGFYYGDASLPQSGIMYTIRVEAEGYRSVEAMDQIPSRLKPPDVRFLQSNERSTVTLYDVSGVENYYAISVLSPNIYWQTFNVLNPELEDQMKRFSVEDPFSPYVNRPDVEVALIHDRPFDGKQFDLSLLNNGFDQDDLSTYINSISKAYYDYYLSKIVQKNAEHLSLVEPAPLKSNIRGGRGVFAGYSLSVDGRLTPENIKNQIIGTYDLSGTQTIPYDSTLVSGEINFTLHSDQSVTGFIKYDSEGGSTVTSLEGGYTITDHGSAEYLVHLHHDTNTFFRNAKLRLRIYSLSELGNPRIELMMKQVANDRKGNRIEIHRTFLKRDFVEEKTP